MSLLRDIQLQAVSSNNKITDLLRKCKILAARLGNKDFEEWIERELNGYKSKEQLPSYRLIRGVESKGHFSGYFGSGLRNASIPPSCIADKKVREHLTTGYFTQSISVYEELLTKDNEGSFRVPWPSDLVSILGQKIYEDMNCMQAWKVIPSGIIIKLIDSVRNRILSFVLEIEKVNPEAGEAAINSEPIPQKSVSQIFNTHIYGSIGSYASGNQNSHQTLEVNIYRDLGGLKSELKKLGIDEYDIKNLEKSMLEDKKKGEEGIGKKTATWLSKMIKKAANGTVKISVKTASQIIPKLIGNYLGM
ncbi:hypothetical protein [Dethiothermospora halolimnae]|uniref:AbiTii domain-containing protein n=1 Tax=Dethiothermospora halolimnae TaxID=3114390 RepID=UPI003CCBD396